MLLSARSIVDRFGDGDAEDTPRAGRGTGAAKNNPKRARWNLETSNCRIPRHPSWYDDSVPRRAPRSVRRYEYRMSRNDMLYRWRRQLRDGTSARLGRALARPSPG